MTMSHHSEDVFMAGSDSFWEPGNFKRTTKRVEDGHKLCTDLMTLIAERAEIEKMYAKSLKQWAAKWQNTIEKGPEYGTMEAAWKAVLVEADRRVTVHNKVKEDLNLGVNNKLKQWQKDNYHKSVLQFKEKKEMEDAFKKAQKPWAKYLGKVNKAKADYHNACKSEKSALNQERNATGDSALSQDQMRKLQDRVQKTKDQVQKSRENYEMAINDINAYNAKYMEDMTEVFEKCQRMEAQRLQCFRDILFDVQKCLNITENPEMPQIYEEFYHTVNNADHEQDLRWWSNTHGVNMAMNWPQFEEYMEEFRDIAKGTIHKKGGIADGSITLINQRHVGDDLPEYNPVAPKQNGSSNHKPPSRNNGHSMAKVPSSTGSIQQQSGPPLSKTANNGQALRRPSVLQERIPPDVIENLGRLDRLERTNGDCIYEEIQERYSFNHLNGSHPYHHSSGFGSMSTLQVQDLELSAPPSYSPTSPLPALKPAGVFAIDSPTLIAARRKIMGKRYEDGPTSPSTPPSLTSSALVEDLDVRTPPLATPCPSEREPLHQEPTPTPEVPNSPVLKQSPKKTQVTPVKRTKRISLVARTNNLPRKESNTTKPRKENFVSQRRQKQSNLSLRKTSKAFH